MMIDSNGAEVGLAFYGRAGVCLLVLTLSIIAAASKIIRCASNDKIPTATIWTAALIVFVGGFVFVAGLLKLLPTLPVH